MNTDDLIALLAQDTRPVRTGLVLRRLATFTAAGLCASLLLLLAWLPLRPDLQTAMHGASFWMKAVYTLAFAGVGGLALDPLSRPGGRVSMRVAGLFALAVGLMAGAAALDLWGADPDRRVARWLGDSSEVCSLRIVALAVPLLIMTLTATHSLAPTRLRPAGAAAGLLAGGLSAAVYALHCPEGAPAFILCWYSLGMLACAGIGALLGPVVLRWR